MVIQLVSALIYFLQLIEWVIVINAILSWFLPPHNPVRSLLIRFIEPIMQPFRRLTAKMSSQTMMIDFSPILAIITIEILINILRYAF